MKNILIFDIFNTEVGAQKKRIFKEKIS